MTSNIFRAPEHGIYRFNLRLHAGVPETKNDGANHSAIALVVNNRFLDGMAVALVAPGTSGNVRAVFELKRGETVLPVFRGKILRSVDYSGMTDSDGYLSSEFSGRLTTQFV